MAHVTEARLAQQMPHAHVTQRRDLLADPRRRTEQRSGGQDERERFGIADSGIGPWVQHDRVDVEIGRIIRVTHVHHMRAGAQQQYRKFVFRLGVGLRDIDVPPERGLSQQPFTRRARHGRLPRGPPHRVPTVP